MSNDRSIRHELEERVRADEQLHLFAVRRAGWSAGDVGEGEVTLGAPIGHPRDDRVARLHGDRANVAHQVVLAHVRSTIIRVR